MGHVTKTVTENVGDVTKTTSHMFESSEDFFWWEGGQVSNQEEKVGVEVGRRYRVVGNVIGHDFKIGERVEVVSADADGTLRASNGKEVFWVTKEELEEV